MKTYKVIMRYECLETHYVQAESSLDAEERVMSEGQDNEEPEIVPISWEAEETIAID